MADSYQRELQRVQENIQKLGAEIPETMTPFNQLCQSTFAKGALSTKEKRLIALAIGVALRSEGCLLVHTKGALEAGATKDEIYDAVGVAILMSGGPGATYGQKVHQILQEFAGGPSSTQMRP